MAGTEVIQWVEDGSQPDADETILLTLANGDVVAGSFDGEQFLEYDGYPIFDGSDVVAWAKWPEGART